MSTLVNDIWNIISWDDFVVFRTIAKLLGLK